MDTKNKLFTADLLERHSQMLVHETNTLPKLHPDRNGCDTVVYTTSTRTELEGISSSIQACRVTAKKLYPYYKQDESKALVVLDELDVIVGALVWCMRIAERSKSVIDGASVLVAPSPTIATINGFVVLLQQNSTLAQEYLDTLVKHCKYNSSVDEPDAYSERQRIVFNKKLKELVKRDDIEDWITKNRADEAHKWLFSVYTRQEPTIVAWKRGDIPDVCASFIVRGSFVETLEPGLYAEDINNLKATLDAWLNTYFWG